MIRFSSTIITILLFSVTAHATPQPTAVNFRTALQMAPYKSGEIIVKFKKNGVAKSVHRNLGGTVKSSMRQLKSDLIRIPSGLTIKEALRNYMADPNVEYAEPNYLIRKASIPNDPLFASQWNMMQISAPQAWDTFTGSNQANSKIIAVLDTGIDYTHPDLMSNLWTNPDEIPGNGIDDDGNGIIDDYYGANFKEGFPTTGNAMDDDTADSHGTHVAGIIGAVGNNGIGIAGVNWNARIMAVKFLHGPEGFGELSDALRGIEYALSKGASIINCSFEVAEDPSLSAGIKSLHDALQLADSKGALVTSAAGNTGSNLDFYNVYPASILLPNNIAVAATGSRDQLPSYSDFGKNVIHVAAPGGDATNIPSGVLGTVVLTDMANAVLLYRTTAGTSMATPHVSALAALIWNLYPDLTAYQVKARIMNSVDKLDSLSEKVITGGRINVSRALTITDLPALFSITPSRVIPGATVAISGVNFGTAQGNATIGGLTMPVMSWSDTYVTAAVPLSAVSGEVLISGLGSGMRLSIPGNVGVTLTADQLNGATPFTVSFIAEVSGEDMRGITYEWDFGDGSFRSLEGSTATTTHTFERAGKYAVRVQITDDLGRKTTAETRVTASGSGEAGMCFITTVACGTELQLRISALRKLRDKYLMASLPGRLFVKAYYFISPSLANYMACHERPRTLVRYALAPLVTISERL